MSQREVNYRRYFYITADQFLGEELPSKETVCSDMGMSESRFDELISIVEVDGRKVYKLDLKRFGLAEFVAFISMFTNMDWLNASAIWMLARFVTRSKFITGEIFGKGVIRLRKKFGLKKGNNEQNNEIEGNK